mmetsp:Transcript_32174/g.102342  ORF Transcript_32174/g.102342 Transcript_32174/m.102342 type:complete len:375 (+) Transcript_32174:122-1246(+)
MASRTACRFLSCAAWRSRCFFWIFARRLQATTTRVYDARRMRMTAPSFSSSVTSAGTASTSAPETSQVAWKLLEWMPVGAAGSGAPATTASLSLATSRMHSKASSRISRTSFTAMGSSPSSLMRRLAFCRRFFHFASVVRLVASLIAATTASAWALIASRSAASPFSSFAPKENVATRFPPLALASRASRISGPASFWASLTISARKFANFDDAMRRASSRGCSHAHALLSCLSCCCFFFSDLLRFCWPVPGIAGIGTTTRMSFGSNFLSLSGLPSSPRFRACRRSIRALSSDTSMRSSFLNRSLSSPRSTAFQMPPPRHSCAASESVIPSRFRQYSWRHHRAHSRQVHRKSGGPGSRPLSPRSAGPSPRARPG